MQGTTWDLWAILYKDGRYHNIGNQFYAQAYALPEETAVEVIVTLDDNGTYYGWADDLTTYPALIQPDFELFDMQFTYGVKKEVDSDKDKGDIVKLRIEAKPS